MGHNHKGGNRKEGKTGMEEGGGKSGREGGEAKGQGFIPALLFSTSSPGSK